MGRFASAVNRFTRVSGESSSRAPAAASSSERLMSSVSWDRAPTRRASAETAAGALSPRRRGLGRVAIARSDCTAARTAGDEREDEEYGGAAQHDPQPPDQPRLPLGLLGRSAVLGFGEVRAGVEELPFGRGQVGVRPFLPLQGLGEADASVQLAGWAPQGVPGLGGGGDVVQDPLAFDVVLQPAAEPRPRAGQRLVCDLDDAVVAGDQPGSDEPVDELVLGGMGDDLAARQPGSDRFAFGAGGDEAEQEVVQGAPLVGVELAVQGLGGLRDRSADPAGGLVAGDGEGPPFTA